MNLACIKNNNIYPSTKPCGTLLKNLNLSDIGMGIENQFPAFEFLELSVGLSIYPAYLFHLHLWYSQLI